MKINKFISKIVILSFLSSIVFASPMSLVKNQQIAQSGYLATVQAENVEAIVAENYSSSLLVLSSNINMYCYGSVKLSNSITKTSLTTGCFASKQQIGQKIIKAFVDKTGKFLYIISNSRILSYTKSPISNKIEGNISSEEFATNQKAIAAIYDAKKKNIYVLTKGSGDGSLISYSIDIIGRVIKKTEEQLSYEPQAFKRYGGKIYIQGEHDIHGYKVLPNGDISAETNFLIVDYGSQIRDFTISGSTNTSSDVKISVILEDLNTNKGYVNTYSGSNFSLRDSFSTVKEIPQNVLVNPQNRILITYPIRYEVREFEHGVINLNNKAVILQKFSDGQNLFLSEENDDLVAVTAEKSVSVVDLLSGILAKAFILSEAPNDTIIKFSKENQRKNNVAAPIYLIVSMDDKVDMFLIANKI